MSDGRGDRSGGSGQDREDGYDWLYASGRPQPPDDDDGEATRVLSTQPRGDQTGGSRPDPDAPPTRIAPTPGQPTPKPPKPPKPAKSAEQRSGKRRSPGAG